MGTPRKRDKQKPNGGERRGGGGGTDGKVFQALRDSGWESGDVLTKSKYFSVGGRGGRELEWDGRGGREGCPKKFVGFGRYRESGRGRRRLGNQTSNDALCYIRGFLFPEEKIDTTKTPDALAV